MWFYFLCLILICAVFYDLVRKDRKIRAKSETTEAKLEKIVVKFKGGTYDITNFVNEHPGGKKILIDHNGLDVEKDMQDIGHTDAAYKLLEKYLI